MCQCSQSPKENATTEFMGYPLWVLGTCWVQNSSPVAEQQISVLLSHVSSSTDEFYFLEDLRGYSYFSLNSAIFQAMRILHILV